MIIRAYRPADRAAVIDLFRAFMQELTTPSREAEFRAYIERAIREELGRIEDYYGEAFWVAEDDGVIGMVGIERHSQDTAEVRRMAVARAHRRKGIGRALLAAAEAYALVREERDAPASHKSAGAGLTRYHYEKML